MMVDTVSIGFVVDPLSIVDVSVYMDELSFAVSSVVLPLALVLSTIWPLLDTVAVSESSNPFSIIGGT